MTTHKRKSFRVQSIEMAMGDNGPPSCPLGSGFERRANARFVFKQLPVTLHLLVRRVVKGVGVSFLLADEQMTLQRALRIVKAGEQFENGRVMFGHVDRPFFPEQLFCSLTKQVPASKSCSRALSTAGTRLHRR